MHRSVVVVAFVPSATLRMPLSSHRHGLSAPLSYTTGYAEENLLLPKTIPALTTTVSPTRDIEIVQVKPFAEEIVLVDKDETLSSSRPSPVSVWESFTQGLQTRWNRLSKRLRLQRPGNRFRLQLGATAVVAAVVAAPWMTAARAALGAWWRHRGFQGLAALGRSVAYAWALLVGYPRLLNRRAADQARKERDHATERRRRRLQRLGAHVGSLRAELVALDKEMRAFRRQVIAMKVNVANRDNEYNDNDDDEHVQQAIAAEMAHLGQVRADTQAALLAARKAWAELRAQSPAELWEDLLLVEPTSTTE